MIVLCERCGNEYFRGKIVKENDKDFVQCPYCGQLNEKKARKKKRRNK